MACHQDEQYQSWEMPSLLQSLNKLSSRWQHRCVDLCVILLLPGTL